MPQPFRGVAIWQYDFKYWIFKSFDLVNPKFPLETDPKELIGQIKKDKWTRICHCSIVYNNNKGTTEVLYPSGGIGRGHLQYSSEILCHASIHPLGR